ncbi:ComEC/Rec2 family competence protein [Spirosoma sp. KUDC1026]|uniref:ComEC/Rec2 family competence protein n=1 Tax=Spirosoma sp. KUDC1026 TaxID=2745947 RepID=UPI00159BA912|nr:ComEC/Rec2 family competence protein [Spirosoma sp. KUDC1026]QKZ13543.1 ComEC family competence protein [Spirosoma sp. KUDC1026]
MSTGFGSYPFVRYAAGLGSGIGLYVLLPDSNWLPWLSLTLGVGLLLTGFWVKFPKPYRPIRPASGLGAFLLLVALGWLVTYLRTGSNQPDSILHVAATPADTLLQSYEGVVTTQPEERAKTYRVELAVHRGLVDRHWQPMSGRILVYLDKANQPVPRYGEVWLVTGTPRLIDPPLNPGEFNYKRHLSYRGIYHQQYLRPFQRRVLGLDPPNVLTQLAIQVNQWADGVFTRQIGSRAEYGIVNAMILGVRDDLDTAQYQAYSIAGAVHILSVSGMHVGILFLVLTFLIGLVAGKRDDRVWLVLLQLAILWFYALVTGFSLPVLRSAGMFSLLLIAKALGRRTPLPNTLGAATFFILLYDPYALFSAGFQLSCLAVAGLGAWQSSVYQSITFRYSWLNKLWELTAVALVAQLVTFPLAVFYFHQFPTYFLLANPLVMGCSLVLLPLAMALLAVCWIPYLSDVLGWLLKEVAWLLNYAVTQTGKLPGAAWDGLWLSPVALILVYAVILCGTALILTRNRTYAWATCWLALLLAGLTIQDDYQQRHQRRLAVHFLPHKTAVSLTDGYTSTLLTDLPLHDTRSYDFYLKNTFGGWGISRPAVAQLTNQPDTVLTPAVSAYHQTPAYGLWVWQGKSILLVNKLTGQNRWKLPAVVDYLIVRRNALRDWEQLNGRVVARHIIFDDSNKTPLTDRLLAEAGRRGIACYSVRQMGAYVADLK